MGFIDQVFKQTIKWKSTLSRASDVQLLRRLLAKTNSCHAQILNEFDGTVVDLQLTTFIFGRNNLLMETWTNSWGKNASIVSIFFVKWTIFFQQKIKTHETFTSWMLCRAQPLFATATGSIAAPPQQWQRRFKCNCQTQTWKCTPMWTVYCILAMENANKIHCINFLPVCVEPKPPVRMETLGLGQVYRGHYPRGSLDCPCFIWAA